MLKDIRKFNRFELKYVITLDQLERLRNIVTDFAVPDQRGNKEGKYVISSLYYDGDDYRFYWEKVEGLKFRRKLRIRHYETDKKLGPNSKVFVEIKQRVDRVTQKRRVAMKYKEALQLCDGREIPGGFENDPVVEEIYSMLQIYDLKPKAITSYWRQAFVGHDYDMGLRVTFDTDLRYRVDDLDLASKKIGDFLISPKLAVLEIKVNERVPYWITEVVASQNVRLVRISKYCQVIEMAGLVPKNQYYINYLNSLVRSN